MSNITFEVPWLSTFVFKKCSERNIFTIIFVVRSLKGLGWNNVGPASQTVAQQYFAIGPMYRVIWPVAFMAMRDESFIRIAVAAVLCRIGCCRCGLRIISRWVSVVVVLSQRRTGIEPAMGCDSGQR